MKRFIVYAAVIVLVLIANQPDETLDPATRLLVTVVGLAVMLLFAFLQERREKRRNDAMPVVSVQAEVTGRRTQMEKRGKYHVRVWYLTFTTQDGSVLEFEVSDIEFSRMDIGETGTLEYRGWEYLGLRRYDLGAMAPVAAPERQDAPVQPTQDMPVRKVDGVLTHELEE